MWGMADQILAIGHTHREAYRLISPSRLWFSMSIENHVGVLLFSLTCARYPNRTPILSSVNKF